MDIIKALRELYTEKKRLDSAIAVLEARIRAAKTGSAVKLRKGGGQRGRKGMSAAERLEVSKRMTLYWRSRRAQLQSPPDSSSQALPPSPEQQASSTSAC